jgi:transposase
LAVVIDMTPRYRAAIKAAMPGALVVVDRFPLLRQANRALGPARVQKSKRTRLETKWKKNRMEKLAEAPREAERTARLDGPDDAKGGLRRPPRMRRAYRARNPFRKIFALKSRQAADAALRE